MAHSLAPALLAVAVVAACWAVFSAWESLARRRAEERARALRSYAEARSLALVPVPEIGGEPGPPFVHGEVLGVPIDVLVERGATRVEGELPSVTASFVMVIEPRHRHPRKHAEERGLREARTGNRAFDAAFALLSNEPDLARSLLDRRLAHVVLGFPRAFVELSAAGKRFALAWRGVETDARVLDAAVEVVFTACRRRA